MNCHKSLEQAEYGGAFRHSAPHIPLTDRLIKTASLVGKVIERSSELSEDGETVRRVLYAEAEAAENVTVADVGCDHAYLSVFLALSKTVKLVIASDVIEGPLASAKENIEKYRCGDRVIPVLTDGLTGLELFHLTDIVICGMGGDTICSILANSRFIKKIGMRLILQPMTFSDRVCEFLSENGFSIECERYALEKKRAYRVIYAVYDGKRSVISKCEALSGVAPILSQDAEAYRFFCRKQTEKLRKRAEGLKKEQKDISLISELTEKILQREKRPVIFDSVRGALP